ncbi:MAG: SCO family protein [Burkholderiales bacterium]|nr:SCO family protein [Burkholderiales bacterium]
MNRRIVLSLGLASLGMLAAGCDPSKPRFRNTDVTGADYAKDFALTDHTGKPVTLASYKGKVVTVFFGFTHCPDVCPTALAEMRAVMENLGPDAARVQVLFVTVDPERDTQDLLSKYVPAFHPSFVGLTSDTATIARTAKDFKVYFQKVPGKTPGSYTVDHSAGTFVFDPQGRLRLFVRPAGAAEEPSQAIERVTADLRLLLSGA